jgi:hypothetical protein
MANEKEEFISAVKEALSNALDERNSIDAKTHHSHHEFVENLIVCAKRRREIFDGIVKYIAGIWIVSLVAFVLSQAGKAVIASLDK